MNKLQKENLFLHSKIKTLNKIGYAFSNEVNPDKLLSLVLMESMNLTQSDAGSIFLKDKINGKEVITFKTSLNNSMDIDFKNENIEINNDSAIGYVFNTGDFLLLNDVSNSKNEYDFNINRSYDSKSKYMTNSMMAIPMKNITGEVVGAIQLLNKTEDQILCDYNEDDKDVLLSVASQLAVTIDRIQTNEKLSRNVSLTRTTLISFFNGMKQAMSTIGEDILEEQDKFKQYATYDPLTGVLSRKEGLAFMEKQLEFARFNGVNVVVSFIDIDGLKYVNDTFGHAEGDELIKVVTTSISNTARENDTIFRYGGDEFILVLYNIDKKTASHVWSRIQRKFDQYNEISNKPYKVSASIGFAEYSNTEKQSVSELIETADTEMYINKQDKKNKLK